LLSIIIWKYHRTTHGLQVFCRWCSNAKIRGKNYVSLRSNGGSEHDLQKVGKGAVGADSKVSATSYPPLVKVMHRANSLADDKSCFKRLGEVFAGLQDGRMEIQS
jgi:hypothetical protein